MKVSDIITLISLIIAIVAIINEKNRRHLLLKFSLLDYLVLIIGFILINYFTFYQSFFSKGIFIKFLYTEKLGISNPENYAYIISIILLVYIFYKVAFAFYPSNKREDVIRFYHQLMENNEMLTLLDLIERYHKKDIINHIKRSKDYDEKNSSFERRPYTEPFKQKIIRYKVIIIRFIAPNSFVNRRVYGSYVLFEVINTPMFLTVASSQRPYLFADIISQFSSKKRRNFPDDLAINFFTNLIKNRNFWLIKELKQSLNFDGGQPEEFFESNRLLGSVLNELTVAHEVEIWKPFGDSAILELEEEKGKGVTSLLLKEYINDDFLWNFQTFITIVFMKVLITEAIVKKYDKSHFWLFYYRHIVDEIITITRNSDVKITEENPETNSHRIINTIRRNLFYWLDLSNEKEDEHMYFSIIDCMGSVLSSICNSENIDDKFKVAFIDNVLRCYCDLQENSQVDGIREKMEKMMLNPSSLPSSNGYYHQIFQKAWEDFDKIPHRTHLGERQDYDYFKRLKEKVIIPLGFNPDSY